MVLIAVEASVEVFPRGAAARATNDMQHGAEVLGLPPLECFLQVGATDLERGDGVELVEIGAIGDLGIGGSDVTLLQCRLKTPECRTLVVAPRRIEQLLGVKQRLAASRPDRLTRDGLPFLEVDLTGADPVDVLEAHEAALDEDLDGKDRLPDPRGQNEGVGAHVDVEAVEKLFG